MSLPSLPLEVSVCYSAMLCCVCMRSRVNRFNYPNKTGGRCNKAAEKKRKETEKRALCAAGGEIYAWLHLHQWRHKCEKKRTCITLVSVVTLWCWYFTPFPPKKIRPKSLSGLHWLIRFSLSVSVSAQNTLCRRMNLIFLNTQSYAL